MQLSVIDVSEHQGNINWEKVKNAGVVGAMIRTGYGVKDPNQIDKWFIIIYRVAKTLACLTDSITIPMLWM